MLKPFLSIKEQVKLLQSRGVVCDDSTPQKLLSSGYYSVINGYKTPFLENPKGDIFKAGTHFDDIYNLFLFDRELRNITFALILEIEAKMKTICAYTFAERHNPYTGYLVQNSYCTQAQFPYANYNSNMVRLLSLFNGAVINSTRESIIHYRETIGSVPIWVLVNELTFGNIEHFFRLMQPKDKGLVCSRIVKSKGEKDTRFLNPKTAITSLNVIVKVRNCCAHNERLYCSRFTKSGENYAGFLNRFHWFVTRERAHTFAVSLDELTNKYIKNNEQLIFVLKQMGIPSA